MKIAFRYLYYKAAASPIYTVDLSKDNWQKFLWADPKDRKKILICDILGNNDWYYRVRELTWIPLSGYEIVKEQPIDTTEKGE